MVLLKDPSNQQDRHHLELRDQPHLNLEGMGSQVEHLKALVEVVVIAIEVVHQLVLEGVLVLNGQPYLPLLHNHLISYCHQTFKL